MNEQDYYEKEKAQHEAFINSISGFVVGGNRHWNNSMYHYEDTVIVYDPATDSFIDKGAGIDFWDGAGGVIQDKTPADIVEKYKQHLRRLDRNTRANHKKHIRNMWIAMSRKCNINYFHAKELYNLYDEKAREGIFTILGTKKFRSPFRESVNNQIRAWLVGPRKYEKPISPKQLPYIIPQY